MLNVRYASAGFVLMVIALFVWVVPTESAKNGAATAKSVASDLKGVMSSLPVSKRVESIIDEGAAACQGFNGEWDVDALEIQTMKIGNEAGLITVVDEASFSCSAGASIYCGSGGCAVHFLSDQYTLTMQLQGWEKKPNSIHLGFHGTACGQVGAVTCYKELTLVEGLFYVE
mgnify:CR=1 FL=1